MRFGIAAVSVWRDEPEQLIESYPCLNDYGYKLERIRHPYISHSERPVASIDVDSMEQLVELIDVLDQSIIISKNDVFGYEIEIYDDYME